MTFLPRITLNITAIIAITKRMCIKPPKLYPKKPIAHAITNIIAMT